MNEAIFFMSFPMWMFEVTGVGITSAVTMSKWLPKSSGRLQKLGKTLCHLAGSRLAAPKPS
jgi:hypothetical protein